MKMFLTVWLFCYLLLFSGFVDFFFCFNEIVVWILQLHNSVFRDLELCLIRAHFHPANSDEDFACSMHIGLNDVSVHETFPSLQCCKWLGESYKRLNPSADYGSNSANNENTKHENLTCLRSSKSSMEVLETVSASCSAQPQNFSWQSSLKSWRQGWELDLQCSC